ncbi:small acid-soluble spore protein I (minor) [Thermoactinomyces sp. DSM 45891]|uniref:small acid-soluble spore protein SspI n=1 Tax=Thermoactinomyces sp. DSM 45891 TaxID=1761907 RepID=UPI0009216EA2|nr:small acid-soluble spore protein SspI [Thermoactinomyces sp. DSM 45891]SFX77341.1 small acid-soluble spore protein I (minor) [Thermoactinomyces sp. DSM 45891]
MNFNIRGAVLHNLSGMAEQELEGMIVDSIKQGDEKLLPGLGVLFEVIWNNSNEQDRDQMIDTLHNKIMTGPKPDPFGP